MGKPLKIVFLGSVRVGKSALIQQFTEQRYRRAYVPTVEDTYTVVIQCPDELTRAVEIMDLSGSDEFPAMRELRIKQGNMFIIVYSVEYMHTLEQAIKYSKMVQEIKGTVDVPMVLVGNKIDIQKRAVSCEMSLNLIREHQLLHMETSARLNIGVQTIINTVLAIKHCVPKETKETTKKPVATDSRGVAVVPRSSLSMLRCFASDRKPTKFPIRRANTFSGTLPGSQRSHQPAKRQESATFP